jgi:hypothetical protein
MLALISPVINTVRDLNNCIETASSIGCVGSESFSVMETSLLIDTIWDASMPYARGICTSVEQTVEAIAKG